MAPVEMVSGLQLPVFHLPYFFCVLFCKENVDHDAEEFQNL